MGIVCTFRRRNVSYSNKQADRCWYMMHLADSIQTIGRTVNRPLTAIYVYFAARGLACHFIRDPSPHIHTPPHDVLLSTKHIVLTWWTDRDIPVMWLTLSINSVRACCLIICSAFNVPFFVFRWTGSRGRCRPIQIQGTWLSYVITRGKSCRWLP